MIVTIVVIAEKKFFSDRSDHSDHMKPLPSDRSDNNLSDRCRCDRWRVVSMIAELFFSQRSQRS